MQPRGRSRMGIARPHCCTEVGNRAAKGSVGVTRTRRFPRLGSAANFGFESGPAGWKVLLQPNIEPFDGTVSPCWASHFFLFGQEKVTKKKATPTSGLGVPGLLHKTPSLRRRSGRRTRRPLTKGRPCRWRPRPIAPRSASMPRVPLCSAYARPPEGDLGLSRSKQRRRHSVSLFLHESSGDAKRPVRRVSGIVAQGLSRRDAAKGFKT